MTAIVKPDVRAVVAGVTVPIDGGDVTLDQGAIPYASAHIVLPLTPETALEDLDPRDGDRVVINASNTGSWAPTWTPWVETRRNLSTNPRALATGGGFGSNDSTSWPVTKGVPVPAPHPDGILTAAESRYTGTTARSVLSMFNADTLSNTGPAHYVGAWFYVTADGYSGGYTIPAGAPLTPLMANTWTWIVSPLQPANTHHTVVIQKNVGVAPTSVRGYITGVVASTTPPASFFDGATVPADATLQRYRWLGTANASASVYETRETGDPLWTPATPRTFNLGIRSRTIHHDAKTVDIDLASDEAILQDYAVLADDITPFTMTPYSLRGVVNYVLGKAGLSALQPGPDADVTPYWEVVNEHRNPAVVGTTLNYTARTNSSIVYVAQGGSGLVEVTVPATTYAEVWAVNSALQNVNGTPGATYIASMSTRQYSGTLRNCQLGLVWLDAANAIIATTWGPTITLLTTYQRPEVVGSAPANTAKVGLLWRVGAGSGTALKFAIDGVMLYQGDPRFTVAPFTGATLPGEGYTYAFQGEPDDSPSVRTPDIERDPEMLLWKAGTTAWDFLQPLLTQAGLRLWCDELRRWWMLKPESVTSPGYALIDGTNATYGDDTVSREDAEVFATGVLVRWAWIDSHTKLARTASDSAGTPGKVFVLDYNTPYPGPGAAAAILKRRNGTGRVMDVEGLAQWSVSPGMETSITLPRALTQQGRVSAVRFSLGDDALMRVSTRGLIDIPVGSWAGWDIAQQWAQVGATVTWASL